MADSVLVARPRPRVLPKLSFGPYGLLEAVPWLMFAAAMRFLGYSNAAFALPAFILSSLALFLAFLLAARRMIEFADGTTQLGRFSFNDQLLLARNILRQVVFLLVAGVIAVAVAGYPKYAIFMLAGFDGIAFDQFMQAGMLWSATLAAIVLLMVVNAGDGAAVSLRAALAELAARWRYLVPAILLVAALQIVLSGGQDIVRGFVREFYRSEAPAQLKNLVYFAFVFGFATLRLWVTLAVLVFALCESYRRAEA